MQKRRAADIRIGQVWRSVGSRRSHNFTSDPSLDGSRMSDAIEPLSRSATIYVAGHNGLVGSALVRYLRSAGFVHVVGADSSEVDLRSADETRAYFRRIRPAVLI